MLENKTLSQPILGSSNRSTRDKSFLVGSMVADFGLGGQRLERSSSISSTFHVETRPPHHQRGRRKADCHAPDPPEWHFSGGKEFCRTAAKVIPHFHHSTDRNDSPCDCGNLRCIRKCDPASGLFWVRLFSLRRDHRSVLHIQTMRFSSPSFPETAKTEVTRSYSLERPSNDFHQETIFTSERHFVEP